MSNTIYLYLKTHNQTGLKYLGKTEKDPHTYKGSGVHWLKHIKKHGYDVTTEILFETTDMEEFKRVGLEYSEKLGIVKSREFANMVVEQGEGRSGPLPEETKQKMSLAKQQMTEETKQKMSSAKSGKNNPMYGHKDEIVKCPHCGKEYGIRHIKRYHLDNCKFK